MDAFQFFVDLIQIFMIAFKLFRNYFSKFHEYVVMFAIAFQFVIGVFVGYENSQLLVSLSLKYFEISWLPLSFS